MICIYGPVPIFSFVRHVDGSVPFLDRGNSGVRVVLQSLSFQLQLEVTVTRFPERVRGASASGKIWDMSER